ncbi:ferritin-like protein [Massilia sp. W12]|uniref:ferritin-like domain-containing protein n=1 Tax=Massilia sp. W12 TaxID=3126507 RepID=UPI0030D333E0
MATPNHRVSDLFARIRSTTDDRIALQEAAQLAIEVEFTTIPAYLTALYSISDVNSEAYRLLRSVVMEEMFHLNQAANTLIALGGLPLFTGAAAPSYPCYLPQANPATTPLVGLYRASPDVFENVFVAIEEPAPAHAPAQGTNYDTIAQLYEALIDGMKAYNGSTPLFEANPAGLQRTDIYLGKFGGTPLLVTDMDSALAGITQIMQQGEGSVPPGQSLVPVESFGAYNHYGQRSDGTYGPIIGTPLEMSHFVKFRKVALDTANFPATYPIISNPLRADFTSPTALALVSAFDCAYSIMLDALEAAFHNTPEAPNDSFFSLVLPLMHAVLPDLARMMMQTPARAQGDASIGPNAAPTYLYTPGQTMADLRNQLAALGAGDLLGGQDRSVMLALERRIQQIVKV